VSLLKNQALKIFVDLLRERPPQTPITADHEKYLMRWCREHAVGGLFYKYLGLFSGTDFKSFLTATHKANILKNLILFEEFQKLSVTCKKHGLLAPVALKGISFLNRLYSPGERGMTDIDIYTPPYQLTQLEKLFRQAGFSLMPEKKWRANQHKTCFSKTILGLDVNFEVHTKLFYNQPANFEPIVMIDGERRILAPTMEAVYLSAHWVHQHTLLKLFWLIDLHRLAIDVPDAWSQQTCDLANNLHLKTSIAAAAYCLRRLMGHELDRMDSEDPGSLRYFLNWPTLVELNESRWKYLCMKHTTKDSLRESLGYDAGWLYFRVKNFLLSDNNNKDAAL